MPREGARQGRTTMRTFTRNLALIAFIATALIAVSGCGKSYTGGGGGGMNPYATPMPMPTHTMAH